jgi:hypothetical protein
MRSSCFPSLVCLVTHGQRSTESPQIVPLRTRGRLPRVNSRQRAGLHSWGIVRAEATDESADRSTGVDTAPVRGRGATADLRRRRGGAVRGVRVRGVRGAPERGTRVALEASGSRRSQRRLGGGGGPLLLRPAPAGGQWPLLRAGLGIFQLDGPHSCGARPRVSEVPGAAIGPMRPPRRRASGYRPAGRPTWYIGAWERNTPITATTAANAPAAPTAATAPPPSEHALPRSRPERHFVSGNAAPRGKEVWR